MERDDFLHELDVLHQPDEVVGEELDRGDRADATGIESRWVDVPSLHQAEHLSGHPAHLKCFAIEAAGERVQGPHDVGDLAIAVQISVGRLGTLGQIEDSRVGLLDHLLAEIDAHQVVLEDVVVEHIFGRLAEVDDPLGHRRRPDAEGHVLRVARAGRMVVTANAADPAGDEVGVARILTLHEDAVAAEDRRGAVALGDAPVGEVDLGVDAQAAHNASDRVPRHLDQVARLGTNLFLTHRHGRHVLAPFFRLSSRDDSRWSVRCPLLRHFGSLLAVSWVYPRNARITRP